MMVVMLYHVRKLLILIAHNRKSYIPEVTHILTDIGLPTRLLLSIHDSITMLLSSNVF